MVMLTPRLRSDQYAESLLLCYTQRHLFSERSLNTRVIGDISHVCARFSRISRGYIIPNFH